MVTVRVERIVWRRPNSPVPPSEFRLSDWGWAGSFGERAAIRVCGGTRLAIGRRYLAPLSRLYGTWYPFEEVRLRLEGERVVGGVDRGEPNIAHHVLAGRTIDAATRLVARTKPYRAVVRDPGGSPARRWQAVDRDHYRVWRGRTGMPETVAAGATGKSRWELYIRRPRQGRVCLGLRLRLLWGENGSRTETCGRGVANDAVTLNTLLGPGGGAFAYGLAGRKVARVKVRFGGRPPTSAGTLPMPRPGPPRFWIVPSNGDCPALA